MVSEWMAKGALMTDQLVSNGNDFLRKYGVIDKIEQAKTVAINQGTCKRFKTHTHIVCSR